MSTTATSSLTECSPFRSASTRRRRVGSDRIWNMSGTAIYYLIDICLVNDISSRGLAPDVDAEEGGQLPEGSCRGSRRPAPTVPAWLPSLTDHVQDTRLPVDGEVEAGNQAVAVQQRHHEVPPALALRYIDLELEIERPEGNGPFAVADEVVERRQQRRPRLERPRLDLVKERQVVRVDVPVALEAELHRNDAPIGFELLPDAGEALVTVPDEMPLHLKRRGDAERA